MNLVAFVSSALVPGAPDRKASGRQGGGLLTMFRAWTVRLGSASTVVVKEDLKDPHVDLSCMYIHLNSNV